MVAPRREKCGVADYTQYLLKELGKRVDVAYETDAEGFTQEMNQVDIVHIQHQYFLFGGVAPWKNWFSRFVNKVTAPAVMTVHEFVSPEGNPARRWVIDLANKRQFLNPTVRRLVVHTELDRQRLTGCGAPRQKIEVVRHGVPPAPIMPERDEARNLLGLQGKNVVTVFGFISRRKGYETALAVTRDLPEDMILLIAGSKHPDDESDFVNQLERAVSELKLTDRVRFTGYLNDAQVAEVMSATDVILAPFVESSGSGSLAMALACGKPIVASPIEPHLEMDRDMMGVLVFPKTVDPVGYAAAIMNLRDNAELMDIQMKKSLAYAESHSYRRMAEETVRVYEQALAESRA